MSAAACAKAIFNKLVGALLSAPEGCRAPVVANTVQELIEKGEIGEEFLPQLIHIDQAFLEANVRVEERRRELDRGYVESVLALFPLEE